VAEVAEVLTKATPVDEEIEAQLDEVMDTIRSGAAPWMCDEACLTELRDFYRPNFARERNNWRRARPKILRLAKYQGALAALVAEIIHSLQGNTSAPANPISCNIIWFASFVVQLACPPHVSLGESPGGGIGAFGPHCPMIAFAALDLSLINQLWTVVKGLFQKTGVNIKAVQQ
jgi:hypothetical protein